MLSLNAVTKCRYQTHAAQDLALVHSKDQSYSNDGALFPSQDPPMFDDIQWHTKEDCLTIWPKMLSNLEPLKSLGVALPSAFRQAGVCQRRAWMCVIEKAMASQALFCHCQTDVGSVLTNGVPLDMSSSTTTTARQRHY